MRRLKHLSSANNLKLGLWHLKIYQRIDQEPGNFRLTVKQCIDRSKTVTGRRIRDHITRTYLRTRIAYSYTLFCIVMLKFLDIPLLRPDYLQLLRVMYEVIRVCLWYEPPLIRLLHKVFISLLLCETNRILLRIEVQNFALHEVPG